MDDGEKVIGTVDDYQIVAFQETSDDAVHQAVWVLDGSNRLGTAAWDIEDVDERIIDVLARRFVPHRIRIQIYRILSDFIVTNKPSTYQDFVNAIKDGWTWNTIGDVQARFRISSSIAYNWVSIWSLHNIK